MAKQKDDFVKEITKRDVDFAQWYTDVCLKTDMVDYSSVRGCMAIKPYGYAVWENIQHEMDARFKATGHKNMYLPLLIPESLLMKEQEHVEGFAPEVAWVTMGGTEPLQERLAIRPTSETIVCEMYAKWAHSYRDLPFLYNQWCNVLRWEKTTRPFLRSAEFLWQEGHTIHSTAEEAQAETERMWGVYQEFYKNVLAIPVVAGRKTEKEKFAGAQATYTIEAMMQDGKALQGATSHYFGQKFAKAYDIQFLNKEGKLEYAYQTSWGSTTRMIGALIMAHGDDRGLVLPPKVAPIQVRVLPIAMHKEGVLDKAHEIARKLMDAGLRVDVDDNPQTSSGFKFNECEMKGIPVRLEIGPRDIEAGQAVAVRRDTLEKLTLSLDNIEEAVQTLLDDIQLNLYNKALERRNAMLHTAKDFDEYQRIINNEPGFIKIMWCGDRECEDKLKEMTGATMRCIPSEQENLGEVCAICGKPAKCMVVTARAY